MKKSVWKADWVPGLLVMLACLVLTETSLLRSLDGHAYNLGMRFSADKPASDEIVIVAIDDESLAALGAWPWSRDIIARATAIIAKSRPKTLGFSIPFDAAQGATNLEAVEGLRDALRKQKVLKSRVRRALNATEARLDTDQQLASTLHANIRIVLGMPYVSGPATGQSTGLPAYLNKFTLPGWNDIELPEVSNIYPPIQILSKRASGVGAIEMRINPLLEAHRYPLIVRYAEHVLPSFALILAARSLGLSAENIQPDTSSTIKFGEKTIAVDSDYSVYPRFYSDKDNQPAFNTISMLDLLNGNIAAIELRHKIILIGLTSNQHVVNRLTPSGDAMSPTLMAAHTISSLINEDLFRVPHWSGWVQKILIVVIGLYLMFLLTGLRKTTGFFVSVFLLLIIINAHFILMNNQAIWVPLMAAVLALVVGHFIVSTRQVGAVHRALSDANRQLGQSFQAQGQFDQAFEKFKLCEVDDYLLSQLYNLGLDYERKRQFNKAVGVFDFIRQRQSNYNDVPDRIIQNKKATEAIVLSNGVATGTHATLILDNGDMQKPMLGRYQIDKEIGRGAMGMVYLGRDEKIGRTVAIKTMAMRDEIEPDKRDEVKSRFFREAEAAGRLNHPNIVTVYDVGDEQDLAFIAMDYLKGKDLTAYCNVKTLLPLPTVFGIVISVARALEYAHEQHVVHRDIKPANIIYHEAKNIAKITDFGVACLTDASKTKTGTVLGSPYYMSPEHLAGNKVDGRADIYSLGVTLYQLLCGELPFTSDSMANLMYKIANEKHPDIRCYRPDIPTCVSNIINRALHKDVEKRFQSGGQMAASMKRCYDRFKEGD